MKERPRRVNLLGRGQREVVVLDGALDAVGSSRKYDAAA
jgi:hypothetical protein